MCGEPTSSPSKKHYVALPSAPPSSFPACPERHPQEPTHVLPRVLPLLRSVSDLAIDIVVENFLTNSTLHAQIPEQLPAISDVLNAHSLQRTRHLLYVDYTPTYSIIQRFAKRTPLCRTSSAWHIELPLGHWAVWLGTNNPETI